MLKRMVSDEQSGLLELHAVISQMGISEKKLERRIASTPNASKRIHTCIRMLTNLVNSLALTAPVEQRAHLGRQLIGLYMHIGVKDKISMQRRDSEIGRLLTYTELDVVADAIRECCRTCTIEDPQQQKTCKYCKLLDALPIDKPDEASNGCGYFSMW